MPTVSVKIHSPDGVPMRFSESLIAFITDPHRRSHPFVLGDWIESLDDETLSQLQVLSNQATVDAASLGDAVQDLLLMVITAVAAEKQVREVPVSPERLVDYFGALYLATSLERFRRAGWLILHSPLSMDADKEVSITLTERGLQEGPQQWEDVKRFFH